MLPRTADGCYYAGMVRPTGRVVTTGSRRPPRFARLHHPATVVMPIDGAGTDQWSTTSG